MPEISNENTSTNGLVGTLLIAVSIVHSNIFLSNIFSGHVDNAVNVDNVGTAIGEWCKSMPMTQANSSKRMLFLFKSHQ